jgi:thymidylate synthase (FAD)
MKIDVLDHGFVHYVGHLGSDITVCDAARVSFNKVSIPNEDGSLSLKDQKLIEYLAKHNHWTPFSHPQITLRVKAPISIRTQLFKSKVGFCLSGDTEITFQKKTGRGVSNGVRYTSINDLFELWMKETPHSQCGDEYGYRKKVMGYDIRVLNTDTSIFEKGHITDIICNGSKDVFLMTTKDGKTIKMTKDHRIYTKNGWETLGDAVGLINSCGTYGMTKTAFVGINGVKAVGGGMYRDYEWMKEQRELGHNVTTIAANAGCSYHTVRKWLKIHNLKFDPLLNLKGVPWNKGMGGYSMFTLEGKLAQSKRLLEYYKNNPRQKQSTTWRQEVNRWTSQIAKLVHEKNGYTCQKCACRGKKLNAHHIIPVLVDPTKAKDIDNLISVCVECHHKIHSSEANTKEFMEKVSTQPIIETKWKKKGHRTGLHVHYTEIVKIEFVGQETVYDISVDHKSHNFVANGMVVHNSENEISRRYCKDIPEYYTPKWRSSPTDGAKQGSSDFMKNTTKQEQRYRDVCDDAIEIYQELLDHGVAPEQARFVLPQGMYTEWIWTGSLAAYARVCKLRLDPHAQWEVQMFAKAISEIIQPLFPVSWKALVA